MSEILTIYDADLDDERPATQADIDVLQHRCLQMAVEREKLRLLLRELRAENASLNGAK